MTPPRHTPGPWYAHMQYLGDKKVVFITTGKGVLSSPCHAVATDFSPCLCGPVSEMEDGSPWPVEANARLIASAPDLLAALEAIVTEYVAMINGGDCGKWDPEEEDKVKAARAALSRAKGEEKTK